MVCNLKENIVFEKLMFIGLIAYFFYQFFLCYKEKNIDKKIFDLAIGVTALSGIFIIWPFYLNNHLPLSILGFLYMFIMIFEWRKEGKGVYFLTSVILFTLGSFQLIQFFRIIIKYV